MDMKLLNMILEDSRACTSSPSFMHTHDEGGGGGGGGGYQFVNTHTLNSQSQGFWDEACVCHKRVECYLGLTLKNII